MKKNIIHILRQFKENDEYTIAQAEHELLDLFIVSNEVLIEACKTVINGYESDGMEGMRNRDEVFYEQCKRALKHCCQLRAELLALSESEKQNNMKDEINQLMTDLSFSNIVSVIQNNEQLAAQGILRIAKEKQEVEAQIEKLTEELRRCNFVKSQLIAGAHRFRVALGRKLPLSVIGEEGVVVVSENDVTIDRNVISSQSQKA